MISSPASSGSSLSTSSRCAWPPSNRVVNRLRKWPSTFSNASSSRTRPSRLRLPIEPRRRWIAWASSSFSATLDSRLVSSSASSCSATRLTGPIRSRSAVSRSSISFSASGSPRLSGVEAEAFGQQRRRAFELLAADAAHIPAPGDLGLGARGRAGPGLARGGERLAGLGQRAAGDRHRFLRVALGRGGLRTISASLSPDCLLQPLDVGGMAVGLVGQLLLLFLHRHRPGGGFGQPLLGLQPAGAPFAGFAPGGGVALAVGGGFAGAGRRAGAAIGDRLAGRRRLGPRRLDLCLAACRDRAARRAPRRATSTASCAASASGARSARRSSSAARCASSRSSAAAADISGTRRLASGALGLGGRRPRRFRFAAVRLDRRRRRVARCFGLARRPAASPGSCRSISASRLARSSRSAAAAPPPTLTKPSQRRITPSRVTSRCPTASGWPLSSSATPTCASRRWSAAGASTWSSKRSSPAASGGSPACGSLPCQRRGPSPPRLASISSPSAAASARS